MSRLFKRKYRDFDIAISLVDLSKTLTEPGHKIKFDWSLKDIKFQVEVKRVKL